MASQKQYSAGGVLTRSAGDAIEVCLIRRERYGKSVWCLPKGHIEPGEDSTQAALREVLEETGVRASIVQELTKIRYRFRVPKQPALYDKEVTFFLMRALDDTLEPQDTTEVVEARWVDLPQALKLAGYTNERAVIKQALHYLSDAGDGGSGHECR